MSITPKIIVVWEKEEIMITVEGKLCNYTIIKCMMRWRCDAFWGRKVVQKSAKLEEGNLSLGIETSRLCIKH